MSGMSLSAADSASKADSGIYVLGRTYIACYWNSLELQSSLVYYV
jgi:hypothetical protein